LFCRVKKIKKYSRAIKKSCKNPAFWSIHPGNLLIFIYPYCKYIKTLEMASLGY
jgi:hypothetical protein